MKLKPFALPIKAVLFAGVFVCGLAVAQQVTISRDSPLLAEPKPGAAVVTQLSKGATVEQIGKQGAWVNLKSDAGTGWVYSFNVTYPSSGGATAAPSSQKRSTTATIGIRGLEAEDLKNATFDANQLNSLDSFATSKQDAEAAAKGAGRKGQKVPSPADRKAE